MDDIRSIPDFDEDAERKELWLLEETLAKQFDLSRDSLGEDLAKKLRTGEVNEMTPPIPRWLYLETACEHHEPPDIKKVIEDFPALARISKEILELNGRRLVRMAPYMMSKDKVLGSYLEQLCGDNTPIIVTSKLKSTLIREERRYLPQGEA